MVESSAEKRRKARLESMVARVARLPVQGSLLPKLQRMLGEVDSNSSEVLEMIKLDPGLTGRILRRSNSAAMAVGSRIGSIEEAVARIGYGEVSRLLFESVTHRLMARPLRCYGLAPGALWRASLACAFAMEKLAEHTQRSEDTAYTIGLLHAVGMVVINDEMEAGPKPGPLLGNPFEPGLDDRERERFGYDNGEIGAELLGFWGFPDSMVEAIRFQFVPTRCKTVPKLACLLGLARWVRDRVCSSGSRAAFEGPESYLMKLADLEYQQLVDLAAAVRINLDEAESVALSG